MLLIGVYGMEMVECGGVLHKNVMAGGASHASILFAGPKMREGLEKSAAILGCMSLIHILKWKLWKKYRAWQKKIRYSTVFSGAPELTIITFRRL